MQLDHRVLGHRLREGVDVGEAHRVGVHAAALDEPVLDPLLAQALGRARDRRHARGPHPRPRLALQPVQDLGPPRFLLDRTAQVRQHLGLVSPVQAGVERRLLAHQASQHPADVGSRDMHEVRPRRALAQGLDQPSRAQEVGLGGEVGGVVELNGRGGVDDDITLPQPLTRGFAQPQAVAPEIDLHDRELFRGEPGKAVLAELLPEPPEGGARQHLALEPLDRGPARARTDGQVDARDLRDGPQAFLDDRLAQEAGAAGDQDGLALEGLGDHRTSLGGSGEKPRREIRRSRWSQIRVKRRAAQRAHQWMRKRAAHTTWGPRAVGVGGVGHMGAEDPSGISRPNL